MVLLLGSCDSQPVADEQVTADIVEVLASLDAQVDDGELAQATSEFTTDVLWPLAETAGQVYAEARADGRRPDAGDVAAELVRAVHGDAFPTLLELFDTYTRSEEYASGDLLPDGLAARYQREADLHIMGMGALLAADRSAAAEIEQFVSGEDDPYAAFLEYNRLEEGQLHRESSDLRYQIDQLGDRIGYQWARTAPD